MSTRFADSNYLHPKIPFYILLCVELVYYIRNAIRPVGISTNCRDCFGFCHKAIRPRRFGAVA